ncbi:PH domain-containing protein [Nocardioides bizhenqiangii]|uniref:PH domain-containing protein n=1 Tax=Nocardioides bizhenqiangii TaxID=3095076 RepID=A0ABZ0ZWP1_9ACTN|nr:PH domain-containing protein [Nocardioides sp. HM61]WQQ28662.1 PH domain-containing protein [Nocardioides sp. HM61]
MTSPDNPDSPDSAALPRTWRPRGPRIAALVFGVVLVLTFAGLWISFPQETKDAVSPLQRATVIFFIGLGLLLLNGLARSRVVADETGLEVVNGYRKRHLEWAQVVSVHMPPGAPWPTMDLDDGTTISVMGIHGSDGVRARTAVAELKTLLNRA